MIYDERLCACGCGRKFWPRRTDQKYAGPWCRAADWRRKHPAERRYERFERPEAVVYTPAGLERLREALSDV